VRLQPRSAFPSGESLVDVGVQLPGEQLVPPVRLGGQCLEPVPLGAQPGQLGVVLLVNRSVMTSGSSSLVRWLISSSSSWWSRPLIRMSRLTGTRNVVAMISFTAASATSIRTMFPHPLRRLPVPVHR